MKSRFFHGGTGSGKTLSVMKEAVRDVLLGRELYANMRKIKKLPYYFVDLEDLILMVQDEELDRISSAPKTLILDEIHTLFDGRKSSKRENIDFSVFISQCRKRHFNIYYTSQWIAGADSRIRTLTNEIVHCIPSFDSRDVGLGDYSEPEPIKITHYISKVEDIMRDPRNYKIRKKTHPRWRNRPFYQFYDTFEIIRPVEAYVQ